MKKIAIIEDDKLYNEALSISFQKEGYDIIRGFNVNDGKNLVAKHPDIMLLDIGLPDGDGIEVCNYVRGVSDIPVIFLTAKDEEIDMIHAYDAGCDDYVVKPFPIGVLKKKVLAVLKRKDAGQDELTYKGLQINYGKKTVAYQGEKIKLSAKEFDLLAYLSKNKGQVLSKEKLLEKVWDAEGSFVDENTVNVTINRLRKKIEPKDTGTMFINNVFGMGYRFGE